MCSKTEQEFLSFSIYFSPCTFVNQQYLKLAKMDITRLAMKLFTIMNIDQCIGLRNVDNRLIALSFNNFEMIMITV